MCNGKVAETPLTFLDSSLSDHVCTLHPWALPMVSSSSAELQGTNEIPQSPFPGRREVTTGKAASLNFLSYGGRPGPSAEISRSLLAQARKMQSFLLLEHNAAVGEKTCHICRVWAMQQLPPSWSYKRLIQSKLLTQRCSGAASSSPVLPHANAGQIGLGWLTGACIVSHSGHGQLLAGAEPLLPLHGHGYMHAPCKAHFHNPRLPEVAGGICWVLRSPKPHHLQRRYVLLVCDASRKQAVSSRGLGSQ